MQRLLLWSLLGFLLIGLTTRVFAGDALLTVDKTAREVVVRFGDQALVKYVYRDEQIPRPYFKDLLAPGGIQVSRNHPPRAGIDADDHALLHPGLWLAFGDLNGQDSWRLKAKVVHERFADEPRAEANQLQFAVVNRYESNSGEPIANEVCRYELFYRADGWLLLWDSNFTASLREIAFGDQEEMGLGVRLATPLTVKNGGTITNSHGQRNEKECWGKAADWCDYSGTIGARRCGVLLMGHPSNLKQCSFHTRDYGFVAANPFAEKAFGRSQQAARTVVKMGESLRLRFGVLVYGSPEGKPLNAAAEFAAYEKRVASK